MPRHLQERDPSLACATCDYWLSRHHQSELEPDEIAVREEAALAAGSPQPQGHCWLMPTPVPRHRSDLCGQHTDIEAGRRAELARAIAARLVPPFMLNEEQAAALAADLKPGSFVKREF